MKDADPIASPTLARLYMAQGHWARARGMLETIVARDPDDGDALALLHRLGAPPGRVSVRRDGDDVTVRWQGITLRPGTFAVVVATRVEGSILRTGVTSVACREPFGHARFALPSQRGALAACIGRVDSEHGFVADAIASPLSWG